MSDEFADRKPVPEGAPLLRTDGLVKIYNGRSVVNGVDINVKKGEIVGLLGPNGAGKTTTFYMIVGLIRPNGGRVFFQDADVTHMAMYRRARHGMGYLPQEESIFRKLTVEQNILAILETTKATKAERKQRCEELLTRFGIDHIAKNQALTLSGGEKRRLTIARSLVTNPALLKLDEPFSGVDPIAVHDVQQIVQDLREQGLFRGMLRHRRKLGVLNGLRRAGRNDLGFDDRSRGFARQVQFFRLIAGGGRLENRLRTGLDRRR